MGIAELKPEINGAGSGGCAHAGWLMFIKLLKIWELVLLSTLQVENGHSHIPEHCTYEVAKITAKHQTMAYLM